MNTLEWVYEWAKGRRGSGKPQKATEKGGGLFKTIPAHIAKRRRPRLVDIDLQAERKAELPDFLKALALIPATLPYERWFEIGAAIHDYDPGPDGILIFKSWSWQSERHRSDADVEACGLKWVEYQKKQGQQGLITKATVYALAQEIERASAIPRSGSGTVSNGQPQQVNNGINGVQVTLPQQFTTNPIRFPDLDRLGRPKPTCANTRVALTGMGLHCAYDTFHQRFNVAGGEVGQWAGDITDDMVHVLRIVTLDRYGFDPGSQHAYDAAVQECLQSAYHPILTYLEGLEWDCKPRIGRWLTTYMQAEDTEFNRESGKLMLMAAVRRVRSPGAKFDQIMVLEGPEGRGKSLALETLAGRENFSDHPILTLDDRAQQEEVRGVWLYEISELTGIRKADIDRVKAFASRTVDRSRPAYARRRIDQPRTCVFFGTTNENRYLQSMTGNRRFWPVKTLRIDVDAIARDRDQLWAEADYHIKQGASIGLAERFWGTAAEIQEDRREQDPWELILDLHPNVTYPTAAGQEWRISSTDLLEKWLNLTPDKMHTGHYKKLTNVMHKLGWEGPEMLRLEGNKQCRGFKKVLG